MPNMEQPGLIFIGFNLAVSPASADIVRRETSIAFFIPADVEVSQQAMSEYIGEITQAPCQGYEL